MDKLEVARRQLGTALDMHLKGLDPVSVHCLICGGSEIAEQLAINAGSIPFRQLTLQSYPGMTEKQHTDIKHEYWNAFKHIKKRNGKQRDDNDILQTFSVAENDVRMFCGWRDYSKVGVVPIEARVFSDWFLALDMKKFAPDFDPSFIRWLNSEFSGLDAMPPDQQRAQLLPSIERWRRYPTFVNHPSIDPRPLVLPWGAKAL